MGLIADGDGVVLRVFKSVFRQTSASVISNGDPVAFNRYDDLWRDGNSLASVQSVVYQLLGNCERPNFNIVADLFPEFIATKVFKLTACD